jgi:hypothetical protein
VPCSTASLEMAGFKSKCRSLKSYDVPSTQKVFPVYESYSAARCKATCMYYVVARAVIV